MPYQTSSNLYTNTKYIVDGAGGSPYLTIQAAINAANAATLPATVFIRPGVYTENLTLYSGIDLEGSENTAVSIVGLHTPPTSGSVSFNRLGFTSATDVLFNNLAGTTIVKFSRCTFAITNGYICDFTHANWTGTISIKYCTDASTTNGIIYAAGAAPVNIHNSIIGAGTAKIMNLNGTVELFNAKIGCPVSLAGSSTARIEGGSTMLGTIITSGSVDVKIRNSTITTGATAAIVIGSSVAMNLNNVVVDSTKAAYCIEGTGTVNFNEATFPNSKTFPGTIVEGLTGVVKTGEIYADTISRMEMTGFYSWAAGGPYYNSATLGTFQLLVGGTGYIKGRLVTWVAQNITGMTSGATWFIYIDSTGTIGKTSSRTDALFVNNIVLFECLYDETTGTKLQHTVKENHAYNYPVGISNYEHDVIGAIIENAANGANITVVPAANVKIAISGADVYADHGLDTTIPDSAGAGVTFKKFYTTAGGKWALQNVSDTFAGYYNNGGTPTVLTGGRFAVYRLYVGKDDLNSATPTYYAILDIVQYGSSAAATTAIGNDSPAKATGELSDLELAQLGFIIFRESTAQISSVIISKTTLRSTISTAGTNTASLVNTNVSAFNGMLSSADTNVQAALDTIDNWGAGTTDKCLMVGNGVGSAPGVLAVGATGEILTGVSANDPAWSATPTVTTMNATTFDTNVTAAGVTLAGTTLAADGTDANISMNFTTKAAGNLNITTAGTAYNNGQIVFRGIPTGGWSSSEWRTGQCVQQTTDATPTAILTIPLVNSLMVSVKILINGFKSDYSNCLGGEILATAYRGSAGNITLVGAPIINVNYASTTDTTDIDALVSVGTQSLIFNVIGVAAQNFNWVATYTYMYTISNA